MALGKNIKRDRLIPATKEESKRQSASKKSEKKRSFSTAKSTKSTQKNLQNQPPKTKKKAQPGKKKITSKLRSIRTRRFLTQEEIEIKRALKIKYDNEIKTLQGHTLQLVKFELGGDQYAIEINKIKEVVSTPPLSKIPHAPEYIKGIASIRGSMTVIMDLAEKFELISSEESRMRELNFTMIIQSPHFKVGILVKEVPTTLKVLGDIIESSAGLVNTSSLEETYIKGLIKLKADVIIFIDIIDLIESDNVSLMIEEKTSG